MNLVHGKYYWIRSEYYQVWIEIGRYNDERSQPEFDLIGSDRIFYAHHFEVLKEIDDYDKSNQPTLPQDNQ